LLFAACGSVRTRSRTNNERSTGAAMASLKIRGTSLGFSFQKTKLKLTRLFRARRTRTRTNKGRSAEPRGVPAVPQTIDRSHNGFPQNLRDEFGVFLLRKPNSKFQDGNESGRTRPDRSRTRPRTKSEQCLLDRLKKTIKIDLELIKIRLSHFSFDQE